MLDLAAQPRQRVQWRPLPAKHEWKRGERRRNEALALLLSPSRAHASKRAGKASMRPDDDAGRPPASAKRGPRSVCAVGEDSTVVLPWRGSGAARPAWAWALRG